MKILFDTIIAVSIGLIYNLIILKFGEICNENLPYKHKIQRNLLMAFFGAIVAFLLSQYFFYPEQPYENRGIRYGLYLGTLILLIHIVLYNWGNLENDSKLIIMSIALIVIMLCSYNFYSNDKFNKELDYDY